MEAENDIADALVTVRDFLRWACTEFGRAEVYFGHGTDNAWDEAVALLRFVLHLPEEDGAQVLDARLLRAERIAYIELVKRRIEERIPAPYLTGVAWFAGLPFTVDQRVIIPRSPIAELLEQGFQPWLPGDCRRILDLCAGSGCIGIAASLVFGDAEVDLADISAPALELARANIARHGVQGRVRVIQSDLFEQLDPVEPYDLIVSNPPYVNQADLDAMPAEFHHEPALALGSGVDGLDITRQILQRAGDYLAPGGLLVVEVGNSGEALEEAYPEFPFTWLEFERGGVGVFVMRAGELAAWKRAYAG
jgi:ribosomal protein L3 glutamine methyltransferase